MTINTTAGKTYAVTPAADCTVSTPDGVLIVSCSAGEQTLFVAPTTEIEISDDAALVTESFKGASAGSAASRGLNDRQAAAVEEIVDASLNNTVIEPHTTATGTDNANFKWCQFAPTRVLPGTVVAVSMPCRTTASAQMTVTPVYLSVFQLNAGGQYEHVGTSENAVVQAIGQTSRWTFRKLQLTGRTTRLCPVPDTATQWTDRLVLGGRVTPVSGEDSKITPISGSGAYVAEAVLEYAHQEPKYATAPAVESHVSDTTAHITADERTTWNNKADASALSGKVNTATFNSHTGNATVHVTAEERAAWNAKQDKLTDESGNMTLAGGITAAGTMNANGGINAVAMLAAGIPKTGLNAGSQAVLSVLGNVYHLDHTNGTVTTLEGSNVKMESVLAGWCGVSWVGTSTAHKCLLIKAEQTNSNYCGAWSPMGTSDYALVMSYLSGINMVDTSTKFGWTAYTSAISATTIEDIPGPAFYTDCVNKKVVAKNAAGETTELPWAGISLDQVSRLDLIVIPSSRTACKIYLALHPSVGTAHGNHYNFNRRYLTPQTYYIGEVPVGLTGNDCHYAILDNCSEQMAMFRVSVIQGINIADYLAIETI